MNPENAIEVRDLKKSFKIYFDKGHMLKERLIFANRNKHEIRWVLNGISFDVKKGEAIGLIGKNGCGKSTTLKLLNRIIYPNGGSVEINGRVSSLIELGAGFHEDMTGRENIYINASIFGLTKKQIDERLDDIIRFSELEEFIDNPVRTYSSGMYMRLAFSVAINVDADVLLIDEILAVGDVNFQEKCFQKLKDVKRSGTTIVIVSHSLGQIEKICDRALWIEDGLLKEDGAPREICKKYLESMEYSRLERAEQEYVMQKEAEKKRVEEEAKERERKTQQEIEEKKRRKEQAIAEEKQKKEEEKRREAERARQKLNATCREICEQCGPDARREGTQEIVFTKIRLVNELRQNCNRFKTGDTLFFEMDYLCSNELINEGSVSVGITRNDWIYCSGCALVLENGKNVKLSKKGHIELCIQDIALLPGKYLLDFYLEKGDTKYDVLHELIVIDIISECQHSVGIVDLKHKWCVDGKEILQSQFDRIEDI